MPRDESFHWLDVELIGELLAERFPDRDALRTSFVELKRLVTSLEGFREEPGHPCNEKILEAIQARWIAEREDFRDED
ncbi:MAG: Fe-S cluster assembly protein IscX [Phycisphaerae bacterium]|jgi:FeS assembly protein IscX